MWDRRADGWTADGSADTLESKLTYLIAACATAILTLSACEEPDSKTVAEQPAGDVVDGPGDGVMPDVLCMNLQAAQDEIQESGVFYSRSVDATGKGRKQVLDRNWTVVGQTPAQGTHIGEGDAVLSVVKEDEPSICDGDAPDEAALAAVPESVPGTNPPTTTESPTTVVTTTSTTVAPTTTLSATTTTVAPTTTVPPPTTTLAPVTAAPTTRPPATVAFLPQPPASNCDPSYPDVCIPPAPPDLDCRDISYRRFRVIGADPHRFDGNNDGIGCESD